MCIKEVCQAQHGGGNVQNLRSWHTRTDCLCHVPEQKGDSAIIHSVCKRHYSPIEQRSTTDSACILRKMTQTRGGSLTLNTENSPENHFHKHRYKYVWFLIFPACLHEINLQMIF